MFKDKLSLEMGGWFAGQSEGGASCNDGARVGNGRRDGRSGVDGGAPARWSAFTLIRSFTTISRGWITTTSGEVVRLAPKVFGDGVAVLARDAKIDQGAEGVFSAFGKVQSLVIQ